MQWEEAESSSKENEETEGLLDGDKRLGVKEKASFGLGHIHNDLCGAIWFSYALVFFQLVAQAGPLLSGILIFVGQTVDAIATPFVGIIVDHSSYSRKTWHLIGTVMSCISFPMVFTKCSICSDSKWSQALYYSSFIFFFQCGWALIQISHLSMLPEIGRTPRDRAELTAYRYTATMMSNIAVYLIALGFFYRDDMLNQTTVGPSDYLTFQEIAFTANILGLVTSGIFQITAKKKAAERSETTSRKTWTSFFQSLELYEVAGVYTASRLLLNLTMEYLPLYITEVVPGRRELASVPLVLFLSSAISAFLYDHYIVHMNHTVIYLIGWGSSLLGCGFILLNYFLQSEVYLIYTAAMSYGIGTALLMVVSLSVAANLIGLETRSGAFVYSAVTFADKLINGIVVVIIQYLKGEENAGQYHEVLVYLNCGILLMGLLIFFSLPSYLLAHR